MLLDFIFACLLLALALCGVVIRKTYTYVPIHELKRQAERRDPLAGKLYTVAAYDSSLRFLLGLFIGLTSAGGFIALARIAPVWLSFIIVMVILWVGFEWLPASKMTSFGARLTVWATPTINWLLNSLHPVLSRGAHIVEKPYEKTRHTGIFERSDLIALINKQQKQSDNRLTDEELEIVKRALSFDEHQVASILIPRKKIKTVLADDTIGPILIDEVHQSGQDFAIVRETPKGDICGVLEFNTLNIKSTGTVRSLMDDTVYYLHEKDTLSEALHAFFATNSSLFLVTNNAGEYIGAVTVQTIIHELLGHIPGDDFDQYADISAVATRHKKPKKTEHQAEDTEEIEEIVLE